MAAFSNFLLCTFLIFLSLFTVNPYGFEHKRIPKHLCLDNQCIFWNFIEFQESSSELCFVNIRPQFKRIWIQSNYQLSTSVSKTTKHGSITLALPHSLFWMDITVCMDVQSNPGPENHQSYYSPSNLVNGQVNGQPSSNLPQATEVMTYSRQQLLNIRSKFTLPPDLYFSLKSQGILKTRRVRAGKLVKSKCFKIQTVHRPRYHHSFGRTGSNLNNLIKIKYCSSQPLASNPLNFCLLNARSINNKTLQIKDYVVDNKIDVLALTETWLKSDNSSDFIIRDLCPTGYFFNHIPRLNRIGGGIGLLYKKNLKMELLKSSSFTTFEVMEVLLHSTSSVTHIVIAYRPPPSSSNGLTHTLFLDEFPSFLEQMISSPGKLLISGDFNFHVDDKSDGMASKFLDILDYFNLRVQNVTLPTHKNDHVLDLIITRSDEMTAFNISVHDPVISDHYAVHCNLNINKLPNPKQVVHYRKIRSVNLDVLCQDIVNSPLCLSPVSNLTDLCNQYDDVLSSILNNHAPLLTKAIFQRPKAPWYTDNIGKNKSIRRNLERRWRHSCLQIDRQSYVDQCVLVKKMIFEAKMNYYSNLIADAGSDNNALFRSIGRLLHKKPEKRLPFCSSTVILANKFVNFFKDKITTIRSQLLNCSTTSNDFYLLDSPPLNCQLDTLSATSIEELSDITSKVISKSCCLDPLPADLLINMYSTLLPTICKIVNLSLETGFIPTSLKSAVLSPLLKKPSLNHEVLGNFRPISNLKVISKIIEKVVATRLNKYLEINHLHEPFQSAYKRFHSCETALVRVQNDILRAIDDRRSMVLLLLDLSAAFDTVDHDILLKRLQSNFGICGNALKWFRSYLSNRTQFVSIDGISSEMLDLKCGVPQGSVLGPILYLLYTSPLADILRRHNMLFHLYADDTQLYVSFSCNDDIDLNLTMINIENCLSDINQWMILNKLKLNKDKTELLFFYSKHSPQNNFTPLRFGTDLIHPSNSARNIGVIFDNTMSMHTHVNSVCKVAFYHLRNIARIRKFLSVKTTETLIHAFITSKIDHCNSLLYGLPKHLLNKLQSVQNAAARIITFSRKYDHITPILINLHWLPVAERIKFKVLILTYKSLHDQAPVYIADLITRYIPQRTLRSSSELLLNHVKYNLLSYGHRSFSVAAPELWNALPTHIRSSSSLSIFKSKLKTHLFKTVFS